MKMVMAMAFGAVVGLSGCAFVTQTHGPDGKVAHDINCSGAGLSWGVCYSKAGDICGEQGYKVIAQSSDSGALVSANQGAVFGTTTVSRTLLISCGAG